jgi:parvulin-like peptidyl-prolyl isomerase
VSLSRSDYWQERRYEIARQIAQNTQLLALFGDNQAAAQFQGRTPALNEQARTIRTDAIDDATIQSWQDYQLTVQGAATLTETVQVSDEEVGQQLVNDLGRIFLPPPLITPTVSLTPTASAAITATAQITPTAGGPTATPAATATPAPTETPQPTPIGAVATTQAQSIIDDLFARYNGEVTQAQLTAVLTRDDFQQGLFDQYRKQVYQRKIQEQLIPDAAFQPKTEPDRVRASQILLRVEVLSTTAQADADALFAARKPEADAIVAQLRGGADFATLARELSEDPGSREQGGDLGFFGPDGMTDTGGPYDPALVEAAFALPENEVSDPVRTQFGWAILKTTERTVAPREEQLRQARTAELDRWLAAQRAKGQVQRFPEPTATLAAPTTPPAPTLSPVYVPGPPTAAPTLAPTTGTITDTGTLSETLPLESTPSPSAQGTAAATATRQATAAGTATAATQGTATVTLTRQATPATSPTSVATTGAITNTGALTP